MFFNAKPGPTGTLTRKGDKNKSRRGARGSCRARVDHKARRLEQHRDFVSLPYNCGAGDRMRYEERPQFSSALTQAAFSLTLGRRIEKGATSTKSAGECSVFSCCQSGSAIGVTELPQDGDESLRGVFPHGFPPHSLKICMSSLSSRQDLEAGLPWGGQRRWPRHSRDRARAVGAGVPSLRLLRGRGAYEYEYCHTLRQRCAIPLVGSQPA